MTSRLLPLLALAAWACGQESEDRAAQAAPQGPGLALPTDAPMSKAAAVVPKPQDQAELDRLILAGYTPHSDHLHPPGVNECPLSMGSDAVM